MKPCIVIDFRTATPHFPGIGRYTLHLVRALKSLSPQLDLRILKNQSSSLPPSSIHQSGRIECPPSALSLSQQWVIPPLLRQTRADLYHSPYYLMPYRPGLPTIVTVYDLIPVLYPQFFNLFQRRIFRWAHVLASKVARRVIAISETTKADLIAKLGIDPGKIVVVPLAVDGHFRPCLPEEIFRVRQNLSLPEKYLLCLGTNKPHKNLETLIRAFAQIAKKSAYGEMKLVIAGPWDDRYPQPKRVVERLGLKNRVLFVDRVEEADLPALYGGAALFAFPSLYEGFGLPVLEAMACGTPVVCSHISTLSQLAEEAAIFVNPGNPEDLGSAMDRVLRGPALQQRMRQRGLQRASGYTWERTARETLAVYETVFQEG